MGRRVKPPRLDVLYDDGNFYILDRRKQISTKTKDPVKAGIELAVYIKGKTREQRKSEGCPTSATVKQIMDFYVEEHVNTGKVVDRSRIMNSISAMSRVDIDTGACTKKFTELLLVELSRDTFRQYERNRDAAPGTIRLEFTHLRAALNHSHKEGRYGSDMIPEIELPDPPIKKRRWLSMDEARRLISATTGRCRLFIYIALATCGRKEAIEDLKWSQIDFDNRMIDLAGADHEQTDKWRASMRFGDYMWELLRHEYQQRTSDYVLGSNADIRWSFNTACKNANLIGVTPHVLRHTAATWMAQDGRSMYEIACALGDTVETVTREYIHFSPSYQLAPAESMNKRITEISEQQRH